MMSLEKLKFPIGHFKKPKEINSTHINDWTNTIEHFPSDLKVLTKDLSNVQLQLQYRPKGWTIAQVVHHCADSHMNSFIRFKLALTEDTPTIRPYFEAKWAELPDANNTDIQTSIQILEGVHERWVALLKSLTTVDLNKAFIHPEHGVKTALAENIGIYAWHCEHHLAHIRLALK